MSKPCRNCGKSQTIEINQKRYCANCGENLTAKAPATSPVSSSKVKAAPKPVADDLPHLLDLSTQPKPQTYRPAQSIHGHRKSAPADADKTSPQTQVIKSGHAQKQSKHRARAQTTARHPQIARYQVASSASQSGRPEEKFQPQPMAPHHIYQINSLEETAVPAQPASKQTHPKSKTEPSGQWFKNLQDKLKFLTRKRRLAPALAVVGVVLALAGYITYLNVPSIAVRIAASRAGIDAQLPNYRPAGYSLDNTVNYSQGQITVRFRADSNRDFVDLTQRRSGWDPQTLLENYVTPKSPNYIPYNQNGLTIYIYGGNSAAWINNGFFYTLEGNNQLSQEQVLRMAASL